MAIPRMCLLVCIPDFSHSASVKQGCADVHSIRCKAGIDRVTWRKPSHNVKDYTTKGAVVKDVSCIRKHPSPFATYILPGAPMSDAFDPKLLPAPILGPEPPLPACLTAAAAAASLAPDRSVA